MSLAIAEAPTTRIDIMSAAVAADPYPALAELRALGPVVWHEGYRRWLVTTDRAVRKLVVDFRRLTVEGTTMAALFGADAFISLDDRRRHDDLRGVWTDAFRKQGLDRLAPDIGRIVADLVVPIAARLRDGEAVDVTAALCRPLPTLVIARMMGVPPAMLPEVVRWSDAMAAGGTAYLLPVDEATRVAAAGAAAKAALADYLGTLLAERRARPGDDLVSIMAVSEPARVLPDEQVVQNIRQLLFAGNETTAKWLAQLIRTYGEMPAVQAEIAADRVLVATANDEVMRWQTVVGSLVRRVRGGPVDLAGVTLADGDEVTCLLASANRDPERWRDPDRLDIHRPPQPNLGFGIGFHNCLGSVLAKIEAETAIDALLDVAPSFAVAAPYAYSSLPLRGPMPVTIALTGCAR